MSWPRTCAPRATGKYLLRLLVTTTTTIYYVYYFLYLSTRLESLLAAGLREAGLGEVRRNGPLREEHRLPNTLSLGIRGVRCAGILLTAYCILMTTHCLLLPTAAYHCSLRTAPPSSSPPYPKTWPPLQVAPRVGNVAPPHGMHGAS